MKRYKEELLPLLKKLPVPALNDTLKEAVEWAVPFLTDEEMKDFKQTVQKFAETEGIELQKRLMDHWEQSDGSWLAPFWEENYLALRGYVQTESNFALVINPDRHRHLSSRAEKAAGIICCLAKNCQSYYEEEYPFDFTRKNEHLDMSFYGNFYGSSRIPGKISDSFYKAGKLNRHAVIVNNGSHYQIDVIDETGQPRSQEAILEAVNFILADSHSAEGEENLAYFTGVERKKAYDVYEQLKEKQENSENLKIIESSLFILSFSDGSDTSENQRISTMLLNGKDQLYTKTIQVIITEKGGIGFNIEHTAVDGVPALNLLEQVFKSLNSMDFNRASVNQMIGTSSAPVRLSWHLTDEMKKELAECKILTEAENSSYHIQRQVIEHTGKGQIKTFKISPDAFFHMALAVAQQRVFGVLKSVYEPVAMRAFYQGRTECARSVSKEKKLFAEAFIDNKSSGTQRNSELFELFLAGIEAHSKRITRCQKGMGVERHLFGLQKMSDAQLSADYFFSSDGIQRLTESFISTTGIPSELLESFSFGPVEKEGFGLYYGILENQIVLTVSSRKELAGQAKQLLDEINQAIKELLNLLIENRGKN